MAHSYNLRLKHVKKVTSAVERKDTVFFLNFKLALYDNVESMHLRC